MRRKERKMQAQSAVRSMESMHKPQVVLRCKLVILGDACVGKTALTQVFNSGGSTYPKNYLMTTAAEFCVKQVPVPETNASVELYIHDCAGSSIFNQIEMNAKYWENASAVMIVYDVTNQESLQSASKWLQQIQAARSGGPKLIAVLVGNKSDHRDGAIDSRAEVITEDAVSFAKQLDMLYFETSAASNKVDEPFKAVANEFYKRYEETVLKAEELAGTIV